MITFIEQTFNKFDPIANENAFEKKAIAITPYAQKVVRFDKESKTVRFYFTVPSPAEVKEFKGN